MDADRSLFTPISRDVRARGALYVSVLVSYVAAVRDDPLAVSMVIVFFLASVWSLGFEHRFLRPFFPSVMKIGLIVTGSIVFVAFFLTGLARPAETFANAIARFLFWNATVFVLSRNKTEYDVWTLGIIDVSLFMISGAFVQPPMFLPLFLAALACVLYAFQRLSLLRCGPAGEQARHGPGILLVQITLVAEIAAVVFFFFPRHVFPARPGARTPGAETPAMGEDVPTGDGAAARTGLPSNPNEASLESLSRLKQNTAVALHLRVTKRPAGSRYLAGQELYLRGAAYERYDRGKWYANYERRELPAEDGWVWVRPDVRSRSNDLTQTIRTTPPNDVVICAGEPIRFKAPKARYDAGGTFFFVDRAEKSVQYDIVAAYVPDSAVQSIQTEQPVPQQRFLALPAGLERLRRRAAEIAAAHAKPIDKIMAMRDWIYRLTYSLEPFQAPANVDPIEYFVFERRSGYCMHFASALALMCRAAGIPARLAGGYFVPPDRYDKDRGEEGGEYHVRHMDAHAWVEVAFPGFGWVRFDPTPPDTLRAPVPPEGAPVATGDDPKKREEEAAKKKEEEGMKRWDRYLVDYDPTAQGTALRSLFGGLGGAAAAIARFFGSPLVLGTLAALAVLAGFGYLLLPREQKQRIRQVLGGFRDRSSVDFYRDFLWLAQKGGLHKGTGLTGREFAAVASQRLPAEAVSLLTEKFYEVRYAGRPLSAEDRTRVRAALRTIESQLAPEFQPPTPKLSGQ